MTATECGPYRDHIYFITGERRRRGHVICRVAQWVRAGEPRTTSPALHGCPLHTQEYWVHCPRQASRSQSPDKAQGTQHFLQLPGPHGELQGVRLHLDKCHLRLQYFLDSKQTGRKECSLRSVWPCACHRPGKGSSARSFSYLRISCLLLITSCFKLCRQRGLNEQVLGRRTIQVENESEGTQFGEAT